MNIHTCVKTIVCHIKITFQGSFLDIHGSVTVE
jgi:hypothetical protein